MKVGIIGYGSMGKMLVDQFAASGKMKNQFLLVSNRTKEKLKTLPAGANACNNNRELASLADIVFLCVKPGDLKEITEEGTKVINERFPAVADQLFEKTLEKRKQTAECAAKCF